MKALEINSDHFIKLTLRKEKKAYFESKIAAALTKREKGTRYTF